MMEFQNGTGHWKDILRSVTALLKNILNNGRAIISYIDAVLFWSFYTNLKKLSRMRIRSLRNIS